MDMLVLDRIEQKKVLESRSERHADRYDEVWDGVYIVSPLPNDEHQDLVMNLGSVFMIVIGWTGLGLVRPGVNVSDQEDDWTKNYRCPDVVVYLNGTTAQNRDTYWLGGPDFLVEVISEYDKSRDKLDFYAKVGSREALFIDRSPWSLELYRLIDGRMTLVGTSSPDRPEVLRSEVLPLSFRLVAGDPRPRIEVIHADGVQRWSA
jgi:Uma2 family endonuclease